MVVDRMVVAAALLTMAGSNLELVTRHDATRISAWRDRFRRSMKDVAGLDHSTSSQ